jgi:hypothetical protein
MKGRPRRFQILFGAVALGLGVLASPVAASASTGVQLAAPLVTPSTTATMTVGTPMTMTISPGGATDHVYGYVWTWHLDSAPPVYSALPSCPAGLNDGAFHFVCGSSVTLRVSPENLGFARFTVWAFDANGNRSSGATVDVSAIDPPTALYPVTHQWTTDFVGTVPAAGRCGVGRATVTCVPDTAGIDVQHPNGAHPLLLPPGVTWDASGGDFPGIPGVLTFGTGNRLPAGTLAAVVDTRQSFAVGAMLTPATAPAGAPMTAIAQEGPGGTGFELGLTGKDQWQFRVHTASGDAVAVAPGTGGYGYPVYLSGVADTINHELRLYFNGSLAATAAFTPHEGHTLDGVATVGGRLDRTAWRSAGSARSAIRSLPRRRSPMRTSLSCRSRVSSRAAMMA